jgi:hypothetical protein
MPAMLSTDLITGFLSFLFTVLILSYIVGDNVAFRLAIHVFIGISAGYVATIVLFQVIAEKLIFPLFVGSFLERVLAGIPLILGLVLLVTKTSSKLEGLGRWLVAFLVGTGAAAAIAGAILGTIFPQVLSTINLFDTQGPGGALGTAGNIGMGLVILLGTISTLAYFQFTVIGKGAASGRRGTVMRVVALLGQVFIIITLGALFAGAFSAALTAFVDRIHFIVEFFDQLLF